MRWIALVLVGWGCGPATVGDCLSGQEIDEDGNCVTPSFDTGEVDTDGGDTDTGEEVDTDPTVDDVLDTLPECEGLPPNGRLDLDLGCVEGACLWSNRREIFAALDGEEGSCAPYSGQYINCAFYRLGAEFLFYDENGSGDLEDHEVAIGLTLNPPYDGATSDGLGLGATLPCFVDALGHPDAVQFQVLDGAYTLTGVTYDDAMLYVYDQRNNRTGQYGADGQADYLVKYRY